MSGLPLVWGATPAEVVRDYPADSLIEGPAIAMTRAVSVRASVETTWRWVCQLSVAPYSYDWVDNLGRRSPRTLTPEAADLEVGQKMVMVYTLTSLEVPHQWTGIAQRWMAATYAVEADPADPDGCRLVCRMVAAAPGPLTRMRAHALAWGDVVMLRKQLLTLKALAESATKGADSTRT
ncbi:hypothetical protein BH09ACT12_BH09ACT12_18840 [soil metagenome]